MKWILSLLVCWSASAQLPVIPYSVPLLSSGDLITQPGAMNIAYYWNYKDIATNQSTITWTDRIQGIVISQATSANRATNSSIGQRFNLGSTSGTFYHLTNILNIATNSTLTNVACFIAFKWDDNVQNSYSLLSDTNMETVGTAEGAVYVRRAATSAFRTVTRLGAVSAITQPPGIALNIYYDAEFGGSDPINKPAYTNAVLTGVSTSCFTNITDFGGTNKNAGQAIGFSGWIAAVAIYTNSVWTATSSSNVHYFRTNLPPNGFGL
jgi:hypothetical protein